MTTRANIEKMLAVEVSNIERLKKEITYDRPQETARIRKDCLDQVLRYFEPLPEGAI